MFDLCTDNMMKVFLLLIYNIIDCFLFSLEYIQIKNNYSVGKSVISWIMNEIIYMLVKT